MGTNTRASSGADCGVSAFPVPHFLPVLPWPRPHLPRRQRFCPQGRWQDTEQRDVPQWPWQQQQQWQHQQQSSRQARCGRGAELVVFFLSCALTLTSNCSTQRPTQNAAVPHTRQQGSRLHLACSPPPLPPHLLAILIGRSSDALFEVRPLRTPAIKTSLMSEDSHWLAAIVSTGLVCLWQNLAEFPPSLVKED